LLSLNDNRISETLIHCYITVFPSIIYPGIYIWGIWGVPHIVL